MRTWSIKIHPIKPQSKMVSITETYQNMTKFMKQTNRNQQSYYEQNIRNCNFIEFSNYYPNSFFINHIRSIFYQVLNKSPIKQDFCIRNCFLNHYLTFFIITNKRKFLINIGYIGTSIWGILMFATIVTDPFNATYLNGGNTGQLVGGILGLLITILGPLGVVFAIDRHFKNKEKKHAS